MHICVWSSLTLNWNGFLCLLDIAWMFISTMKSMRCNCPATVSALHWQQALISTHQGMTCLYTWVALYWFSCQCKSIVHCQEPLIIKSMSYQSDVYCIQPVISSVMLRNITCDENDFLWWHFFSLKILKVKSNLFFLLIAWFWAGFFAFS